MFGPHGEHRHDRSAGARRGRARSPAGNFRQLLDAYRQAVGIGTPGVVTTIAPGGQSAASDTAERSLDVGVADRGQSAGRRWSSMPVQVSASMPTRKPITAYQAAFWDTVNNPRRWSSFVRTASTPARPQPRSPFFFAGRRALRRRGPPQHHHRDLRRRRRLRGYETANGAARMSCTTRGNPYSCRRRRNLAEHGRLARRRPDPGRDFLMAAMDDKPATIWKLVAAG